MTSIWLRTAAWTLLAVAIYSLSVVGAASLWLGRWDEHTAEPACIITANAELIQKIDWDRVRWRDNCEERMREEVCDE